MGFGDTGKKEKQQASAKAAAADAKGAAETAGWKDNSKDSQAKESRAGAAADSAEEKARKKAEVKALEEAENAESGPSKAATKAPAKVTQAEIQRRQALLAMAKGAPKKSAKSTVVDAPKLEENLNRQQDGVVASGIDAALDVLGAGAKKTKVTFKEFEERVLAEIKEENPGLKTSQMKEKAFKMWERSPENPKNQEKLAA
mmetsp:Transcript_41963/g.110868  ORF Transcript_41963/g.110868 Transcript_41963/m.110868 type:complete len:201 (-) Transcript_41963:50-652(-)